MMDYLQDRYDKSFGPGAAFSLDESLVQPFGRIKFKVRIITKKSAEYGIKIYVIADAQTAFVLCVILYTGQYTYYNSRATDQDVKRPSKM
jgi:hypothetical protein